MNDKKETDEHARPGGGERPGIGRQRQDNAQPVILPGIRRYHSFSNLKDRALTKNLNRAAMAGITAALGLDVLKAVSNGNFQTVYCYECRACYATQDKCPVGIAYQAKLVVASRVHDFRSFVSNGGLKCIRCGNCQSYCVQYLETPKIFGIMQQQTMAAIRENSVPPNILKDALGNGLVGRDFIDEIAKLVEL